MESQADEKLQVGAGQPVGRRGCGPLSLASDVEVAHNL